MADSYEINLEIQGGGAPDMNLQSEGGATDGASARNAEAWAVGKRNGTDVPSTDPTYHNNAKYYATDAAGSAADAAASAAEAAQYTPEAIHTWLEENIDPDSGYALDRTLSEKLEAAPADMVGDLKNAFNNTTFDRQYGIYDFSAFGTTVTITNVIRGINFTTPDDLYLRKISVKTNTTKVATLFILSLNNGTATVIDKITVYLLSARAELVNGVDFYYPKKIPKGCTIGVGTTRTNSNIYTSGNQKYGGSITINAIALDVGDAAGYNVSNDVSISAYFTTDNIALTNKKLATLEEKVIYEKVVPSDTKSGKAYKITNNTIVSIENANLYSYENIDLSNNYFLSTDWNSGNAEYPAIIYLDSSNQVLRYDYTEYCVYLNLVPLAIPTGTAKIYVNSRDTSNAGLYIEAQGGNASINVLLGTRNCTIDFQFDDGTAKDADLYTLFKSFNRACGFALISTITTNQNEVARYLGYQADGFEVLSHSTSGTSPSSETPLRESKGLLESVGFKIRGWVTPSSQLNDDLKPYLRKYYDFAETIYNGDLSYNTRAHNLINESEYDLWRISLQSCTYQQWISAVDTAIANGGHLTFYGHATDYSASHANFTPTNMTNLLNYIVTKENAGYCKLLTPSGCYDNYFKVRHDDLLKLHA